MKESEMSDRGDICVSTGSSTPACPREIADSVRAYGDRVLRAGSNPASLVREEAILSFKGGHGPTTAKMGPGRI